MQRDPRKRVVRTKLAMEIAGMNPLRFNDIVAAGHYRCAPPASPGKARRFREADLIGLYWFQRMVDQGMTVKVAGDIACRLVDYLQEHAALDGLYSEARIAFVECTSGSFFTHASKLQKDLSEAAAGPLVSPHHGFALRTTIFELAYVRQLIAEKIEEWDNAAGDEDE